VKVAIQVAWPEATVWLPPVQEIGELLAVKVTVPPPIGSPLLDTVAVSRVELPVDVVYVGFSLELTVVVVEGKLE
jgi:hypothetical protein